MPNHPALTTASHVLAIAKAYAKHDIAVMGRYTLLVHYLSPDGTLRALAVTSDDQPEQVTDGLLDAYQELLTSR